MKRKASRYTIALRKALQHALYKCHYCGNPTNQAPYTCASVQGGDPSNNAWYPSCCARPACLDKWSFIVEASPEAAKQAVLRSADYRFIKQR